MSKIVFISGYRLSFPGGGGIASRALYSAVKRIFEGELVIISSEEDKKIVDSLDLNNFVGVRKAGLVNKFKNVIAMKCLDRFSPDVDRWLYKNLEKSDILFINGAIVGRFCEIAKEIGVKNIFLIHHNIEKYFFRDNWPRYRFRFFFEKIIEKNQTQGYRNATHNLFLTDKDREYCIQYYGKTDGVALLIPSFLPPEEALVPKIKNMINYKNSFNILLLGSLNQRQFLEPFRMFSNKIWPEILKYIPKAKLIIGGYNPPIQLINASKINNIELYANPNSTEELYVRGDVFLSLTDGGSGKKYRIIGPLKWGLPIVAHECSLEGYKELEKIPLVFSFSKQEEIIDKLLTLYKRSLIDVNERLNIQKIYLREYSFEAGLKKLKELIAEHIKI